MRAITAKYIFDGVNLLTNKVVLVADKLIVDIVDRNKIYDWELLEDFGESVISAGMLDLQLNGCGGVLFNADISLATLETMHQTNLRFGTCGFLPTLITSPFSDVIKALEVVKEWFNLYGNLRGVLGIHLEGPFLSKEKRGIHPEEFILLPTDEMLSQIASYAKFFPVKMTLAPEHFSASQLEYLVNQGIIISLGHSNASYAEATAAFKHGARTVTHMFNAMSGMTGRNPGVIAAVLANSCYLGLIADLLHVDKANIQLLHKLKPASIYLVSDAVTPTGTAMDEFDFAGKHLYVINGKCVDAVGTIGGAYLTLNKALANCVEECGISLEDALAMATVIPAQVLGVDKLIGKISKGLRADLIALNLVDYTSQTILHDFRLLQV